MKGIVTEISTGCLSLSSPCCCPLPPVAGILLLVAKSNGFLLEMVLASHAPSSPVRKPPKRKPSPTQPNRFLYLHPALHREISGAKGS